MKLTPPSIFNDVIGPVMRGPSSSHTAASVRIGKMLRQILGEKPAKVVFTFDPKGALATTYKTQGSAIGLAAGLLGWEITHADLDKSLIRAAEEGINILFKIAVFENETPHGYRNRGTLRLDQFTLIFRGLASGSFGNVSLRTPSCMSAPILS